MYRMVCLFTRWGVSKPDGVFVYWMKCLYTVCMGCSFTGWGDSIQEGMLVYRMGF